MLWIAAMERRGGLDPFRVEGIFKNLPLHVEKSPATRRGRYLGGIFVVIAIFLIAGTPSRLCVAISGSFGVPFFFLIGFRRARPSNIERKYPLLFVENRVAKNCLRSYGNFLRTRI